MVASLELSGEFLMNFDGLKMEIRFHF